MSYRPADSFDSPRFTGIRTFMRLPHQRALDGVDAAIVGIPFDTAASVATGQRFGPEAVRSASILLRPYDLDLEIDIFQYCSAVDFGDLTIVPGYLDDSFERIEKGMFDIVRTGVTPFVIGGDHSVSLPELRAVAKRHGPVGLVHFDAHVDTWDEFFGHKYDHGTTFRRAVEEGLIDPRRSIQVGIRGPQFGPSDIGDSRGLGFEVLTMKDIRRMGVTDGAAAIRARLGERAAFLSLDVDVLDPAYAPGTGTPEVGGFTSHELLDLLAGLSACHFAGFDVVEVLPSNDPARITSILAANLMHRLLALHADRRRTAGLTAASVDKEQSS